MISDLQKASMLKRFSAYLLDVILLVIAITGIAFLLSTALDYDSYQETLNAAKEEYADQYGVSLDKDYSEMTAEEKERYDDALEALNKDEKAMHAYSMMLSLILLISSLSILLSYLLLEFFVPLLFRNGQTIGKKVFGIALMRTDSVRISSVALFARTLLGKCTLETMVPVAIVLMILMGSLGIEGTLILLVLLVLQAGLLIATKTNSCIHDLMAGTVVVELASQMIFESEEAMLEYRKRIHAEQVERSKS